jgi:hypothetical protein
VTEGLAPPSAPGPSLRGHFAGGALESAAHILGSTSASIFVAGLVGPYIAALSAPRGMSPQVIFGVSALALLLSVTAGAGAVVLRGLAHCAPHGVLKARSRRRDP